MSKITQAFENATEIKSVKVKALSWSLQIMLGSLFLALMAQIAIPLPFSPVPVTLQTLGVALLAITLGSQKAPWAVVCYLTEASLGWPVLAGGVVSPSWMIGTTAGYLIGFMISAYLVAKLLESQKNAGFLKNLLCVAVGDVVTIGIGSLWLAYYVGFEKAFLMGALPFLPGAVMKTIVATTSIRPVAWAKNKLSNMV